MAIKFTAKEQPKVETPKPAARKAPEPKPAETLNAPESDDLFNAPASAPSGKRKKK